MTKKVDGIGQAPQPAEPEGKSRKATMIGDTSWGRALVRWLKEVQDINGHAIQRVARESGIPFATLHEHMEGSGRLSLENFLLMAKYGRVPPPELLRLILPADRKNRSPLRSQIAAEPLSEQLSIAQEILARIETDLIDRRRESQD